MKKPPEPTLFEEKESCSSLSMKVLLNVADLMGFCVKLRKDQHILKSTMPEPTPPLPHSLYLTDRYLLWNLKGVCGQGGLGLKYFYLKGVRG